LAVQHWNNLAQTDHEAAKENFALVNLRQALARKRRHSEYLQRLSEWQIWDCRVYSRLVKCKHTIEE
jgi:hypothetical protein